MIRVSSTDFQNEVGHYQDAALSQPVVVTRDGQHQTVLISAKEYRRLRRRDRDVLRIEDFTDEDVDAVRLAEPSKESEMFNAEVDNSPRPSRILCPAWSFATLIYGAGNTNRVLKKEPRPGRARFCSR
jgi:prevent-host-death family protein